MTGMLAELLDSFRKSVTIEASPESITFSSAETTITCPPVLRVGPGGRILGIGDPPREGNNEGTAVRVFNPPIDQDALIAFFRRGFMAVGLGPFSVSPRVEMSGVDALRPVLGPQTETLLSDALRGAGAGTVKFTA